ncbi:SURF1 family protein [Microvirga sp. SRT01]|uniref:SURF1-like protein n=1 Tax=Sphingomonas longa TaxID=2778730 RepID=A0ABS2D533_9SPHN|nr:MULTISPECIES: SURF1 family protein [Alphaproteobacteria]MBM6576026.1 SURF1 family protein [Sphingomonas sp. BT552]MBR7709072.1 SURF1 family protein [Microvirga sp. SRT01]
MKRRLLLGLCVLLAFAFAALGVWQVERRAWKLDLIGRVTARSTAAPAPLPPRAAWREDQSYRRVRVTGTLLNDRETLVQAVTDYGPGWWVMTPLRTDTTTLLVNRGFVPNERRDPKTRQAARSNDPVTITGLLRTTEPGGGFLRSNDPAAGRWYSRDVAAIARARGLRDTAPFFLDADATPNPGGYPVGGLTVIAFRNNHLVYALTWFALAALSVAGAVMTWRKEGTQ